MAKSVLFTLLISLLPVSLCASGDKAWVVTSVDKPVECISPISVYSIDGELVHKNQMNFEIEPGRHTLVGTVSSFAAGCPTMRTSMGQDVPPLDYEFEAGKTYYIGLQHKSANQQSWRFVVWRVKD
jgi:hypothetical protein